MLGGWVVRKLIVNSDDLGFNKEITDGILECHNQGCVTSTTLMVNMPAAEYAVGLAKSCEALSVGLHLNVTLGTPISNPEDVRNLVDERGEFGCLSRWTRYGLFVNRAKREISREFSAQIQRMRALGCEPSHLDSHHNVTVYPVVHAAMLEAVGTSQIKRLRTYRAWYRSDGSESRHIRLLPTMILKNLQRAPKLMVYEWMHRRLKTRGYRSPDRKYGFHTIVAAQPLVYDVDSWVRFVRNVPPGVTELVTHPGYMSDDPRDRLAYRKRRLAELTLFSNPATRSICLEEGVELISYRQL